MHRIKNHERALAFDESTGLRKNAVVVCLSDETLRNLLCNADQTSSTAAISHLVNCPDCQGRVFAWNEQPRLEAILRLAGDSGVVYRAVEASVSAEAPDTLTRIYGATPLRKIGQYELLRTIGRGGGGEVFEARHTLLRRRLAIKLLAPRHSGNEAARQRFFQEMESIGQLNDPCIVHAYDAGEIDGTLYLAMELVDGENVESLAHRVGPMPVSDACEIIRQAALGLQHIYASGLVHRDLKPSNLLMSKTGVKIADLGLALLIRSEPIDDRLTGEHTVLGTVDYMAPEQAEKSRSVDIRADLYSLGCTLFRLLAGRPPFAVAEYDTPMKKLWAHSSQPIPDILQIRPEISAGLVAILQTLMAKDRNDRYAEPRQLVEAITPFCHSADYHSLVIQGGMNIDPSMRSSTVRNSTSPVSTGGSTWPSTLTHPTSMVAMAMIICVVLAIIAWGLPGGLFHLKPKTWVATPSVESTDSSSPARVATASDGIVTPADAKPQPLIAPAMGPIAQRWSKEFGVVPIEVQWPGRTGIGSGRIDEDLRSLVIQTHNTIRLVKLGEVTPDEQDVTLGIDILPQSAESEYGIFLGFQAESGDQPSFWQFQAIQIKLNSIPLPARAAVSRSLVKLTAENSRSLVMRNYWTDLDIPAASQRLRLEINVRKHRLVSVSVCGQVCDELFSERRNAGYQASDYIGAFGLFSRNATTWFSNPHFEGKKR